MKISTNTRFLGVIDVDTETLSPEVVAYLFAYGLKQSVDDAGANPEKGKAGSQERYKALLMGDVPSGGGTRVSTETRHTRDVVAEYLVKVGFKKTDARKAAAENPQEAFGNMLILAYQKKTGKADGLDKLESLLDSNWPKVEAEVAKRMAIRAPELEVEIGD